MKIAHLYPHNDILTGGSGPSLRVSLLLKFLQKHVDEIHVVAPEKEPGDSFREGIHYHIFKWNKWQGQRARIRRILKRNLIPGYERFEVDMIHNFIDYHMIGQFKKLARQWVAQSDAVLLEYPFWGKFVGELCKEYNKPLIITAHDVHALTFAKPGQQEHPKILALEMEGLKPANALFCVSPEDQKYYAQHDLDVTCTVNPIDVEACKITSSEEAIRQFRSKYNLADKVICMFVGQKHFPNIEAVDILKKQIAPHTPDCHFVVAGTCAPASQQNNVTCLGFVSDEDLRALYATAALIVMPLKSGTGTSLKFVESMASGKAILASPVAARGYTIDSPREAIIEGDFTRWPEQISALLKQPEKLISLAEQAQQRAKDFDYQKVYLPYAQQLKAWEK